MKKRVATILLVSLLFVIAGCGKSNETASDQTTTSIRPDVDFTVSEVAEVGIVPSPTKGARDGGVTGLIGGKILWTFGDTLIDLKKTGGIPLSSTAAIAPRNAPLQLTEPISSLGGPSQFLTYPDDIREYNRTNFSKGTRIAYWPTGVIPKDETSGYVFATRLKVLPGTLNYDWQAVELFSVKAGATQAFPVATLWESPGKEFSTSPFVHEGHVYVYGCENKSFQSLCSVARAKTAAITRISEYEYWDGARWQSEIKKSKLNIPGSTTGFSITWNPYLERFVAVINKPLGNDIVMRTAARPQGPWSEEKKLFTGQKPHELWLYAASQHPEFGDDGGQTLWITYFRGTSTFTGDIHLVKVKLNKP